MFEQQKDYKTVKSLVLGTSEVLQKQTLTVSAASGGGGVGNRKRTTDGSFALASPVGWAASDPLLRARSTADVSAQTPCKNL